MTSQVQNLIAAIGSLAEMCGIFYQQLLKNGFSKKQALELTKEYLINAVKQ